MTLREHQLRLLRRSALMAVALLGIGILQVLSHRWWVYVPALIVAALFGLISAASWWTARQAQPWQDAPEPKRPRRWVVVFDAAFLGLGLLEALVSFTLKAPIDGATWLLAAGVMGLMLRIDREARRLTKPAEVPVRPGPPQEWL